MRGDFEKSSGVTWLNEEGTAVETSIQRQVEPSLHADANLNKGEDSRRTIDQTYSELWLNVCQIKLNWCIMLLTWIWQNGCQQGWLCLWGKEIVKPSDRNLVSGKLNSRKEIANLPFECCRWRTILLRFIKVSFELLRHFETENICWEIA